VLLSMFRGGIGAQCPNQDYQGNKIIKLLPMEYLVNELRYYHLISCFFGKNFLIASWKTSFKKHFRYPKMTAIFFVICNFFLSSPLLPFPPSLAAAVGRDGKSVDKFW
jgi:hypothetical protein